MVGALQRINMLHARSEGACHVCQIAHFGYTVHLIGAHQMRTAEGPSPKPPALSIIGALHLAYR